MSGARRDVMLGTCVHWDAGRGIGKIRSTSRRDFFAERLELVDVLALRVGQLVEFYGTETPRGPRALAVRPWR